MRHLVGPLTMILGSLHILFAIVAGWSDLGDIVGGGLNGLATAPAGYEAAFWSLLFGVFALTIGYQLTWAESRFGRIPAFPGWAMVAVGLFGGLLALASPFWLVLLLGVAILVEAYREPRAAAIPAHRR